jgi:hypothetical protein
MQPEQPQQSSPSTDAQVSDGVVAESGSDERQEGSSPGWWQRLFGRGSSEEGRNASGDSINGPDGTSQQTLSLTQEEIDRRVQAETDRREELRAKEARKAAKKALRDKDPFAYADLERQEEEVGTANNQLGDLVTGIGQHYDRASIDPVVLSLPEEERKRILSMDGVGAGLDGRKKLVTESLKALEKHWKAEGAKDAETKLRRNSAFRKQLFSEFRGGMVEPDLLPGGASSTADETVSALLRSRYGFGR